MHISDVDTPAVLIDLDIVERNIHRAQQYLSSHGIDFRPHLKTHKLPQIGKMQIEAGAVGLTCAKIGEAEVFAEAGLTDLQICYPIWGEQKLRRLVSLAQRARVRVCFDSHEVADAISLAARSARIKISALAEVDTGTARCGLPRGPQFIDLCQYIDRLPGLEFVGVMTYEGWARGSEEERVAHMKRENENVAWILDELRKRGLECQVVSGGATPTLFQSEHAPLITEQRAGTYIFNDRNTVGGDGVGWDDCAMRIVCTVVSMAVPGQMIIDGGSKTFTSDPCGSYEGFGRLVEDPAALFWKMNEEHGYVKIDQCSREFKIGDRVHVIPNHVCVAMNMHDEVRIHRDGKVVDTWPVAARGKLR